MKANTITITTIALTLAICSFSCTRDLEISDVTSEHGIQTRGVDGGEFFYSGGDGEKAFFNIRKDRVIIKTNSETEAKELCRQDVFLSDRPAYDVACVWVLASIDPEKTSLDDLLKLPGVADVTYGLEYDGVLHYPQDVIYVNFKETAPDEALKKAGLTENVVAAELYDAERKGYDVTLDAKLGDILRICRDLYESGLCEWVEPSFFREMKPSNQYYPTQWGLKNTGQYGGTTGIDIKAEQAWATTRGSSNIKVAIIDDGVDLTHPDLQGNLLPGYDATVGAPGGANGSPWAGNAHGTACAGIVGAIDNTIGVVGVAPDCKIVPIRIAYDLGYGWITNDDWISAGIDYAWRTAQVDVLSNSWGGGYSSTKVNNAIYDATDQGRGGKGCVVVFASGNYPPFATVSYPASLPDVIAVGAIDITGIRSIWSSSKASNYGPELDVVAPGTNVYTTDIQGVLGYNTASVTYGDYYSFGGTSAACPHVAGIAALVLSTDPRLTGAEVRDVIESTCQKINSSTYSYNTTSAHPNGTWNNELGYGLIDAGAAVAKAQVVKPRLVIDGPLVQFSPVTMTWENLAAGNDYMFYFGTADPLMHFMIFKEHGGQSFTFIPPMSGTYPISTILFAGSAIYVDEQEICVVPGEPAWIEGPATLAPGEAGTYRLRTASQTSLEPLEGGEHCVDGSHTWHYGVHSFECLDFTPTTITFKSTHYNPYQLPETVTISLVAPLPSADELVVYTFDITLTN